MLQISPTCSIGDVVHTLMNSLPLIVKNVLLLYQTITQIKQAINLMLNDISYHDPKTTYVIDYKFPSTTPANTNTKTQTYIHKSHQNRIRNFTSVTTPS